MNCFSRVIYLELNISWDNFIDLAVIRNPKFETLLEYSKTKQSTNKFLLSEFTIPNNWLVYELPQAQRIGGKKTPRGSSCNIHKMDMTTRFH